MYINSLNLEIIEHFFHMSLFKETRQNKLMQFDQCKTGATGKQIDHIPPTALL